MAPFPENTSVHPLVAQCWATVCDSGPTVNQPCGNVSYMGSALFLSLFAASEWCIALSPQDASNHHFTSLKTDFVSQY